MEGLTILYVEQVVAGHGFDITTFWILSICFIIASFLICIPAFIHEAADVKSGICWGSFCGSIVSAFMVCIAFLIATLNNPIYEQHYTATINFAIINQQDFEEKYEIVEQKGTAYIIRERVTEEEK